MDLKPLSVLAQPQFRKRIILAAVSLLLAWLAFFDSHSLSRRIRWHHERVQLETENEQLQRGIEELQAELERGLSDEKVEQIAREQYHMKRPEETVYQVKRRE